MPEFPTRNPIRNPQPGDMLQRTYRSGMKVARKILKINNIGQVVIKEMKENGKQAEISITNNAWYIWAMDADILHMANDEDPDTPDSDLDELIDTVETLQGVLVDIKNTCASAVTMAMDTGNPFKSYEEFAEQAGSAMNKVISLCNASLGYPIQEKGVYKFPVKIEFGVQAWTKWRAQTRDFLVSSEEQHVAIKQFVQEMDSASGLENVRSFNVDFLCNEDLPTDGIRKTFDDGSVEQDWEDE